MESISSDAVPAANGHYAQAIRHDGVLYISGQLPLDAATREPPDGFPAQAELVLARLAELLAAGGSGLDRVLQLRIYIVGVEHWPALDRAVAAHFGSHFPARAVVPVPALHYGCLVELEAIASVPG